MGRIRFDMSIAFWITEDCNLTCEYCYESVDKKEAYMSKDTIDRSIKFIENELYDGMKILIHGGEPFLAFKNLEYLVDKINFKARDVIYLVTTNGTILNDEVMSFIKEKLGSISISIDGIENIHDRYRCFKNGKGSFSLVMSNALKIKKEIDDVRIRMTFNHDTVEYLYDSIQYLVEKGFKIIDAQPNNFDEKWNQDHSDMYEEQLILIKEFLKKRTDVLCNLTNHEYKELGICIPGRHILPNGNIYPCILSVGRIEFLLGNVFEGLDEKKIEEIYHLNEIPLHIECNECSLNRCCEFVRCKIVNKCITGDYSNPPVIACSLKNIDNKVF